MKLNQHQRWLILGSLLAATLGAGLWLDDEAPDTIATPRERRAPGAAAGAPAAEAGVAGDTQNLALATAGAAERAEDSEAAEDKNENDGGALIDPFRPATWRVAPPPPPPKKPKAPGLPFKYLGKMIENGAVRVFLSDQDRHLIVRAGEVINGNYKVAKISDGQIVFVYLPLKERQVLPIGGD